MPDPTPTATTPRPAQAHLLIHAEIEPAARRGRRDAPWQRLLALWARKCPAPRPLRVRIHDVAHHEVAAFEEPGALLDVTLPEGTYHVMTELGSVRRGYTMTLQAGGVFDLYLPPGGS